MNVWPVEIYENIAANVEDLKTFASLALVCTSAASGCAKYKYKLISKYPFIKIQIVYNFSGHLEQDWGWFTEEPPFCVDTRLINSICDRYPNIKDCPECETPGRCSVNDESKFHIWYDDPRSYPVKDRELQFNLW